KQIVTWKVDRETRRAILYTPSATSPNGRMPLVFSFHGRGDTMENFEYTDMHIAWPEAMVVYFQGLPGARGLQPGWQNEKGAATNIRGRPPLKSPRSCASIRDDRSSPRIAA